jgi:predicted phage tail protein
MRRLRDHTIKFRTTYDGIEGISTGVGPGDYIRAALDTTVFDQFNNGVVLANGTIVSTTPLANGTYNVISWSGTGNVNDAATLTVSNGQGTPTGIIFTVKQVSTQTKTYQISSITPTENGTYDIEAVHMPTGSDGKLLAVADWDSAGAWVIER